MEWVRVYCGHLISARGGKQGGEDKPPKAIDTKLHSTGGTRSQKETASVKEWDIKISFPCFSKNLFASKKTKYRLKCAHKIHCSLLTVKTVHALHA